MTGLPLLLALAAAGQAPADDLAGGLLRKAGLPARKPADFPTPSPRLAYLPTSPDGAYVPEALAFVAQFRPILVAEYELILSVGKPDRAQRRAIARAGEAALARIAYVAYSWNSGFRPGGRALSFMPDPRKAIQDALASAVEDNLPPEVATRYLVEARQRKLALEQATRHNLVARFDQALHLTSDQRDQFLEALETQWSDEVARVVPLFLDETGELPPIPDSILIPILVPAQRKKLASISRARQVFWVGYDPLSTPIRDPLPDADLPAPAPGGRLLEIDVRSPRR